MKMDIANLIISIVGAAINLFLLSQDRSGPKPMFALLSVLLILRAVHFGFKLRGDTR